MIPGWVLELRRRRVWFFELMSTKYQYVNGSLAMMVGDVIYLGRGA